MTPVRVVVVEDSLAQRRALVQLLQADGSLVVVGEAGNADEAIALVEAEQPDVVTMDLEIPGERGRTAGGIVAIETIMGRRAVPILVLSSHVRSREDTLAIDALAAGAVDVFPKDPTWGTEAATGLRRRLLVLARLRMVTRHRRDPAAAPVAAHPGRRAVVGLAASTGGPSALRTVLSGLVGLPAPILVVQHIHADFAASFAQWLQDATGVPVRLGSHGERPTDGHVHVAPPEQHMRLTAGGTLALAREPQLLSRPSCDELLLSIAEHAGTSGVGVVLTGMGDDGAKGLLALRERGGTTFAQDGESSAVDGMPRAARENGGALRTVPLDRMSAAIREAITRLGVR